jgi:hypothetical protein
MYAKVGFGSMAVKREATTSFRESIAMAVRGQFFWSSMIQLF